jgi:hypothetical protein
MGFDTELCDYQRNEGTGIYYVFVFQDTVSNIVM